MCWSAETKLMQVVVNGTLLSLEPLATTSNKGMRRVRFSTLLRAMVWTSRWLTYGDERFKIALG